ncbi:ADP-ribose glycohydrolase MACROD2 isoform X1 [Boleophthalmus pectinirostris]|uniref:ADP-ribose glycohydrolase MACROD2 isoform X1 n=1 Tax=Boleophthalmus pectinirostris TaxID=150288 RepID=UPI000A1C6A9B|nr:ADP-ribose glycohydrolase MACROD2 isoform X1 [Boleophthalmus pectinirostris]
MSKKKKDWKNEKERLLRLDREERRKEYRRQDYISLDKIPTWREENSINDNEEEDTQVTSGGGLSDKVSLYKGDITLLEVDAIVNAANSSLLGGGGVDGCIHKAAGSCLFDECHSLNGCETGKAKITCGYDLPARYVIHTVGPVARGHVGPSETSDLTACYQNSLRLLKEHGLSTVAFPCISTGIYGFPNEPAADIALNTVKNWIEQNPDKITRVIFCVFLETDFNIYKKKMAVVFQDNDMEAPEEQQKDDTIPPSPTSTPKEEEEEANRGADEAGDEEEDTNDAEANADVDMMSQTQDEEMGADEPNPEENQEQDVKQGKGKDASAGNNKDEDTDAAKSQEKAKEEETEAKPEQEAEGDVEMNTQTLTVEVEDDSNINESGTSNVDMKEEVKTQPDLNATDNSQSKDTDHEKKD